MDYTLIDPEENSNKDYCISQAKYDALSASEQELYEPSENLDEEGLEEEFD